VVHHKAWFDGGRGKDFKNHLGPFVNNHLSLFSDLPLVLFVAQAHAKDIPPNAMLDPFDLVIKREPYRDRRRYEELSKQNRKKIRPTMLSCPLVPVWWGNRLTVDPSDYGRSDPPKTFDHNIFFAGTTTSSFRAKVLHEIRDRDEFHGGLIRKNDTDWIPDGLEIDRLPRRDYLHKMWKSKINLALRGYGQLTYRHLESWALGSFIISDSSLDEVELPMPSEESKHYVTFDDPEELPELIDYYLNHPNERKEIARNGRRLYEEYYNFDRHAEYLASCFQSILTH
jgi:hypothetical protein